MGGDDMLATARSVQVRRRSDSIAEDRFVLD